jgi:3-dehydroquinate synthase II
MKKLWVNVVPYDKGLVIAALESGAEAVVVPDGSSEKIGHLGRIKTVAKDGDIRPGVDVVFVDIAGKQDEDKAARVAPGKVVVLRMLDWTIIPIENLLARRGKNIIVQVVNSEQARLMIGILEKGVDGVLLNSTDINEIKKTAEILQGVGDKIELVAATITTVKQLGMGDRSCLDTSSAIPRLGFSWFIRSRLKTPTSRPGPSASTPAPYTPIRLRRGAAQSIWRT